MCVAAIGTVVSINGRLADVDFQGNMVHAEAGLVKVMAGDHVLVHAGCIIQKLTEQDNEFMTQLLEEVEEVSRG